MKVFNCLIVLVVFGFQLKAQIPKFEDTLYLKSVFDSLDKIEVIIKQDGVIRDYPLFSGNIQDTVKKGEGILAFDIKDSYWAILYKGKIGYLSDAFIDKKSLNFEFLVHRTNYWNQKLNEVIKKDRIIGEKSSENNEVDFENFLFKDFLTINSDEQNLNYKKINRLKSNFDKISLSKKWYVIVHINGCLLGKQYFNPDYDWPKIYYKFPIKEFLELPDSVLIPFLIDQLGDTSASMMHTCPFFLTRNGELATYFLQYKLNQNWYELDVYGDKYLNRETNSSMESYQTWLWYEIFESEQSLRKMQNAWWNYYKKK